MRISVITVNRNNRSGLLRTIGSVVSQTLPPFEFIVVDGASTDGSADLLEEFDPHITYGVSEADSGIYNAMNKGVTAAHGDYCLFMNSGDVFHSADVLRLLDQASVSADIICGNAIILSDPPVKKTPPAQVSFRFFYRQTFCHQAVLIRTRLLKEMPYEESLTFVADRKFFLDALVFKGYSYAPVDIDVVDYDVHGFSSENRFASEHQWDEVLMKVIPPGILADYGRDASGPLFGPTAYDRFFLEVKRRNYRFFVYRLVRMVLSVVAVYRSSARFVYYFPKSPDKR